MIAGLANVSMAVNAYLLPLELSLAVVSVKKLLGTGTGYFRIKAWDGLKRETVSEVRSFAVQ